jgi:hypothetical protein
VEPQVRILVRVSQEDVDAVTKDLDRRRAHGIHAADEPGGTALISAQVPESEVARYELNLIALAEGATLCEISSAGFTALPNYLEERYLSAQLDSSNSTRLSKQLRNDLRIADDRHEVRVSTPPWHHVLMQMPSNAGTGNRALIHPDIESLRPRHLAKHGHGTLRHRTEFSNFLGCEV